MKFRLFSPLTRRILVVNIFPLATLVAGILYHDEYRHRLVETKLAALETQAQIFAGALGVGAIGNKPDGAQFIRPDVARQMLPRLTAPTRTRARVFGIKGEWVADSRLVGGRLGADVQVEVLSPPNADSLNAKTPNFPYKLDLLLLPERDQAAPVPDFTKMAAKDVPALQAALDGNTRTVRWAEKGDVLILAATAPVRGYLRVLGAVLLTAPADEIDADVRAVRYLILKVFVVVLAVTVLLSLYLAGTIARPVRRLAAGADAVRRGHGEADSIPEFRNRKDEIGDLSASLRDMTDALWQRIEANESFAADVAHELKNPLTSLRSAVETVSRVRDPEKQAALMEIIEDDVKRLDRLISDISDASRLDAELARGQMDRINLDRVLAALVQVHCMAAEGRAAEERRARLTFKGDDDNCAVNGIEGRLVQVFQNLISNAESFTPPEGEISLSVQRDRNDIVVRVDDQGPGIPVDCLGSIFERFYSERPDGETFGRHSGLGLFISRQIVEAHGGAIHAENLYGDQGKCRGARFIVRLPASRT